MDQVFGICGTNKCKREVPSKEEFDNEPKIAYGSSLPDPKLYKNGDVFILTET